MIERIPNNKYKMMDITTEKLKTFGFRKIYSEPELYSYRFVLDQYKNTPTLFCNLILNINTGYVNIIIKDNNENLYPPFYQELSGYDNYIEKLNNKIKYRLSRMDIKKVKERNYKRKHGRKDDINNPM